MFYRSSKQNKRPPASFSTKTRRKKLPRPEAERETHSAVGCIYSAAPQPGAPAPPTVQGEDADTQQAQESKRQRLKKIKNAEEQLIKAMLQFEMEQERREQQWLLG